MTARAAAPAARPPIEGRHGGAHRDPAGTGDDLLTRREFLRGFGGLTAAASLGVVLQGCAPADTFRASDAAPASMQLASGSPAPTFASAGGPVLLGSNQSDPVPRAALQAVVDAFTASTGLAVRVNTVDHASFENQIANYLQGRPDDVFTWFAGNRMRFFAARGLAGDVGDVWDAAGGNLSAAFRTASTGDDGRLYFVPFYNYPWVLIHRRSTWARLGYQAPATFPELLDLARRMQADGLVPFAFADREGWPAMGTFDILDLRLNGYDFHIGLLEGRERWTDPRTKAVFDAWRDLLPFTQPAALGRTWQEAARTMLSEGAGMFFAGTFAAEQATDEQRADLELLPFPLLGTRFDAEHGIDAPINGFMLRRDPVDRPAAVEFLKFVAGGRAQDIWTAANPTNVAAASDADRSRYTPLQRRAAEIIAGAGRIAQFMNRDARPDFTGQAGMPAFLQDFLTNPEQDVDPLLRRIQDFWDSLD